MSKNKILELRQKKKRERKHLKAYVEGKDSHPNEECPYKSNEDEFSGDINRIAWWDGFFDARFEQRMKKANSHK